MIPPRLTVVTLGARDLDSLCAFYRGLGWSAAIELDGFAAFETSGAVLTLYPLDQLAEDAGSAADPGVAEQGPPSFSLAINVDRPEQVDETIAAARGAGARIAKEPVQAEWGGRSGYFVDPEDNHWEVAWVPRESAMAALMARATRGRD